ncbi:hypothetical protein ZWY2020_043860 [Hordeum vulgare]|nr:hypothetical protein ZWY2020_043860 [Hordeum vulgare]
MQVPGAGEGPIEGCEEVEGVEAGVEVVLDEREQVGAPAHVVLAGEDDADHLLGHLYQAAGDLAEGADGHGPHLHPGGRRRRRRKAASKLRSSGSAARNTPHNTHDEIGSTGVGATTTEEEQEGVGKSWGRA